MMINSFVDIGTTYKLVGNDGNKDVVVADIKPDECPEKDPVAKKFLIAYWMVGYDIMAKIDGFTDLRWEEWENGKFVKVLCLSKLGE